MIQCTTPSSRGWGSEFEAFVFRSVEEAMKLILTLLTFRMFFIANQMSKLEVFSGAPSIHWLNVLEGVWFILHFPRKASHKGLSYSLVCSVFPLSSSSIQGSIGTKYLLPLSQKIDSVFMWHLYKKIWWQALAPGRFARPRVPEGRARCQSTFLAPAFQPN